MPDSPEVIRRVERSKEWRLPTPGMSIRTRIRPRGTIPSGCWPAFCGHDWILDGAEPNRMHVMVKWSATRSRHIRCPGERIVAERGGTTHYFC